MCSSGELRCPVTALIVEGKNVWVGFTVTNETRNVHFILYLLSFHILSTFISQSVDYVLE